MICQIDTELADMLDQMVFFCCCSCFLSCDGLPAKQELHRTECSALVVGRQKKRYDKLEKRTFQNPEKFLLETLNNVLWTIKMFWTTETPQLWAQTVLSSYKQDG